MNIWESDKLLLFIAFIIPGFVSIKVYELFYPVEYQDSSKKLIDTITYSCINYALLSPLIYFAEISNWPSVTYMVLYIFILFIAPILWVLIWGQLRNTEFFQSRMPHPANRAWDFVFSQRKSYWVIVTLKDGTKLGGWFGCNSFVSCAPYKEQIYLERSWELNENDRFDHCHEKTQGVLIVSDEISHVELFE